MTCTNTAITACVDDDGCCPAGCTDFTDTDCPTLNDTCAGGTDISAGGDFQFSLLKAKQNLAAATCDSTGTTEVFFSFQLTTPSAVYLDVFDPAGNTVNVGLELYGGGCPVVGTTPLDCDIESGAKNCQTTNPWPRIVNVDLDNGNYVVVARTRNALPERYTLRFQRVPTACIASGALQPLAAGNTCGGLAPHDQYSPTCAASGDDKTYFLIKCPATGLTVDTCSKTPIDTVLQVNEGSIDLVSGNCVVSPGRAIGCNNDNPKCLATSNLTTSSIVNTGRGERGIFTITVDTFSTAKCGAYELNAAVLP